MYKFLKTGSFKALNITQFLGALNDNVFKLLIVFLLINMQGKDHSSSILATTGAIFVIPFLLFSAAAGVLADRLSKRNILVSMKLSETLIMVFSVIAIFYQSKITLFILLFLMAAQSTIFGPSKYGIIPEIVPKNMIPKANGILTSLTFLAIIIGTFLASFITDLTDKNFFLASFFCVAIAFTGLMVSLKIEKTPAKRSSKKISVFFVRDIYKTLKLSYKRRYLLPSILGASFFLFIGGFVQLNTIPFAIQTLGFDEVGGGYLFLSTALGITIGSFLAGKLSKGKIELGLSCICGFLTGFLLILLGIFSNVVISIILLTLLGAFGGMFLIPFESFLQAKSPHKKRGQVIASSSFLSFLGVLIASGLLYLLENILDFSAASGFICLGLIMLFFNIFNTKSLIEHLIFYIFKNFSKIFKNLKIANLPKRNSIFLVEKKDLKKVFFLLSEIDNLKIISLKKLKLWNLLYPLSSINSLEKIFKRHRSATFCLIVRKDFPLKKLKETSSKEISFLKINKTKSFDKISFHH